ncbi:MAG: hypothetical protein SVG88_02650 [Halobacteriales archaeon]|nr:hypothetical protein [Halobacteriales archaeon]
MDRRTSLLWGLIGGLSFLVLIQAYELLVDVRIGFSIKFGVAALVTLGAAVLSAFVGPRITTIEQS